MMNSNRDYISGVRANLDGKLRFECPIQPTNTTQVLRRMYWMQGWLNQESLSTQRGVVKVEDRRR